MELSQCSRILKLVREMTPGQISMSELVEMAKTIGRISCPGCCKKFREYLEGKVDLTEIDKALKEGYENKNPKERFYYEILDKAMKSNSDDNTSNKGNTNKK